MDLYSIAYNPTSTPGIGGMMPGMFGMPGAPVNDLCCPTPCPPHEELAMQCHHPMPAPVPAPIPAHVKYVVKKGDSVYKIAKRYGTTMQAIILGNNLRNPNLIYPGQILIIPGV
jgi:FOG: LysM repeat